MERIKQTQQKCFLLSDVFLSVVKLLSCHHQRRQQSLFPLLLVNFASLFSYSVYLPVNLCFSLAVLFLTWLLLVLACLTFPFLWTVFVLFLSHLLSGPYLQPFFVKDAELFLMFSSNSFIPFFCAFSVQLVCMKRNFH